LRGHTLDTRPVQSASKRVLDRGGRHRRTWRRDYGKFLILYAKLAKSNHCTALLLFVCMQPGLAAVLYIHQLDSIPGGSTMATKNTRDAAPDAA